MFETTELFEANITAETKIIVNQGGTWSGKTYSILQALAYFALTDPNSLITIVGQDIPNLKAGALRDFQNIISDNPIVDAQISDYNKSDRIYKFVNGSMIEFKSYDNSQDAKSGKRDYLFLNEANGIDRQIAKQLLLRTKKKAFIDFNPDAEFWVHEDYLNNPTAKFIYSDHRNNPFVPNENRAEIEALKDIDIELWKVYARGITGRIEGLIYRNWTIGNVFPEVDYVYGLDFGYNHPTTLVKCGWDENKFYLEEVIYESGLTTADLIEKMQKLNIGQKEIFADAARPDTIEELYRAGFNVFSADKSVKDGINTLKAKPIILVDSPNGVKEFKTYKWKTDKNQRVLDEPVKFDDHAMDAMRYGVFTHLQINEFVCF